MSKPYQICNRCVMDTSDEDITFDKQGNCNHCTHFLESIQINKYKKGISEKQWEGVLKKIKEKGKNRKYDCLVGISGGVDSSYVAHLCKEYGLRPVLLHFNNGWNTELGEENVKIMSKKLGFDLIEDKVNWEEFKQIQLAFLKSSIVDLEIPTDLGILGINYKIAKQYNIPTILSGGNFSAEGILPLTWGYHMKADMKLYRHIIKKYGNALKIKHTPTAGFWDNFYIKFIEGIKTIYPLNYIDYDKDKMRSFLIKEYGFKDYGWKHQESSITGFWQGYVMPKKYNMDLRRATLSSQICAGQISRNEALEILKSPAYDVEKAKKEKEIIAKKWDLSLEKFEEYLNQTPKTYKDFPNRKKMIDFFYTIYFKLKKC